MSWLDVNMGDIVDPKCLGDGTEVQFQVVDVEQVGVNAKGEEKNYVKVELELLAEGGPWQNVMTFINFPRSNDDGTKTNNKKRMLRDFAKAIDLPQEMISQPDSWIGKGGYGIVGFEDDPNFGKRNTIKRYLTPGA